MINLNDHMRSKIAHDPKLEENFQKIAATNPIVHCGMQLAKHGDLTLEESLKFIIVHLMIQNDRLVQIMTENAMTFTKEARNCHEQAKLD